jgi:hypothetical protein
MIRFLLAIIIIAASLVGVRILQMKLKAGVLLENVSWRMFWAALVVDSVFSRYDVETVITSGVDGSHSAASLHYQGLALDFRTRDLPAQQLGTIKASIQRELGASYDVVIESDHLHIEYDPKETA